MELNKLCQEMEEYLIQTRRYLHRHPELSYDEKETSAFIKKELNRFGISYEDVLPGYNIVATISCGKPGKTVVYRADIDALPVTEDTGVEYQSCVPGKSHACGHDAHVAIALGVAKILNEKRESLSGTIKICFQAAEERGGGIFELLDYLKAFEIDQVVGMHIWSGVPKGEILLIPGAVFAGSRKLEITIKGQGGHGSRPDQTTEPIKAACDLTLKLSSIPSNMYDVFDPCVVSICAINSGNAANIFPNEAKLLGGVRFFQPDGGEKIEKKINQIANGVGKIYGVEITVDVQSRWSPIVNDPEAIALARKLVPRIEGLQLCSKEEPCSSTDNFCCLTDTYPGFYAVLGAGNEAIGCNYIHHHEKFNIDEKALRKGTEFIATYLIEYLNGE